MDYILLLGYSVQLTLERTYVLSVSITINVQKVLLQMSLKL